MSKILIAYFSATNTTKNIAEKIKTIVNGDIFEIKPLIKYTNEDLNWMNPSSRSSLEMNDKESRPQISEKISNLNYYDNILIGFPIWWYTAPTIINSFIEENDLSNKKIYLFATSGGSSIDKSFEDLQNVYPNINFISGKRFNGNESSSEIMSWLNVWN